MQGLIFAIHVQNAPKDLNSRPFVIHGFISSTSAWKPRSVGLNREPIEADRKPNLPLGFPQSDASIFPGLHSCHTSVGAGPRPPRWQRSGPAARHELVEPEPKGAGVKGCVLRSDLVSGAAFPLFGLLFPLK